MQYSMIAAALVATVAAVPGYAPPAYEAPAPPAYPTEAAPVYPVKPVYPSNKTETYPVVYPVHKETKAVVYPVHGEETKAIVYPTKTEEIKTITVCKAEHGATDYPVHNGVVTITKTLTQTIVNGDKKEYKTDVVYETKPVVFETKTDVHGSKETIPVYPVKPTENKPVAPVYPAKNNGTSPPAKVYPTAPVKYTGAASSLSVAGFVAGAGAIAAFFL